MRTARRTLILFVWRGASTALACPKCYGSSGNNTLETYYLSTAMLTLLPFVIGAALVLTAVSLKKRFAAHAATEPLAETPQSRSSA